ncbi:MAG TPA: bifunctional YncE family protein/alkaline phosphatase family protein [Candidatus Limnocylindria bacterium]|jgi:DNA-binding beta-propeller fold protein YncE|nr:bifunctional YncE family protein/alkaline phosphatase family protein [Candidatus Limnocylindria bacterium]
MKRILILAILWQVAVHANGPSDTERVGRYGTNRVVLPVNQVLTPYGRQLDLPGLRPQVLAISPDGKQLVTSGKTSELLVIDPATGVVLQKVDFPNEKKNEPHPTIVSANILKPDTDGVVSYTGLVFAPGGRRLFLSNVNGSIKVFNISTNGRYEGSHSWPLPLAKAPRRKEEIPAGLAISTDGRKLYVCGNLSNTLLELDADTGVVLRTIAVGAVPYDVVICRDKAYVSNWGGRRPDGESITGPAGRGTLVRVDAVRNIANEGSVSVIDLATGTVKAELAAGLHSSALALSPDGKYLVCANATSDNLSVFDTRTDTLAETIWVKPKPSDLFGASPNALAFDPSGKTLYVANGTQNAVAVIRFHPAGKESMLTGLIPVGWFPGALAYDARRKELYVANIKGHAAHAKHDKTLKADGFNSHQNYGSLSLVPVPAKKKLQELSQTVWLNLHHERILETTLRPRTNQPPRAVPERAGEPSLIRHVVYVIKENRTYDQVLGDIAKGNGNSNLCIFGEKITPNQHRLVDRFVLLDNTYCCSILSADGHQWSTTAFGTDYLEKSFANWPRSYPDGMGEDENDALAYAPSGFIWDNARAHQVSQWNFGEFAMPTSGWKNSKGHKGAPKWSNYWDEFLHGTGEVRISSEPSVEAMRPFTPTNYVGWIMEVPDVWRARYITNQLAQWVAQGEMPQMVLICLPNDHTSGTSKGSPTPAACLADNDLAFGQIVEALSHSPFWKDMAIFGIEDDPQAGWDHVSGYRTTAYVASPYARRGAVVSTQYNTTSILRTMEQILGMPPMNQFDASAVPMYDCFTDSPDFAPYNAVASNVPLDEMNPDHHAIVDPVLKADAIASNRVNFREVDKAPEDLLNRILWRAMRGPRDPYPEWAITVVEDDD